MARISLVLMVLWICITPAVFAGESRMAPAELRQAIGEARSMLDNGDYEAFLKRFLDPEDLDKILRTTSLEDLTKSFAQDKVEDLKSALAGTAGRRPEMSEDESVATFRRSTQRPIVFRQVNGVWYLRN